MFQVCSDAFFCLMMCQEGDDCQTTDECSGALVCKGGSYSRNVNGRCDVALGEGAICTNNSECMDDLMCASMVSGLRCMATDGSRPGTLKVVLSQRLIQSSKQEYIFEQTN